MKFDLSREAAVRAAICVGAAVALAFPACPAFAAVLEVPATYATIQAAVNAAGPGDTVEVSNGTYNEMVSFPASGSAGNPITLAAKAGHAPVIDGTGLPTTDLDGLVFIEDRSYITVSGMEIANLSASSPSHFPAGIWIRGTAHHIQLLGNTVHHIENAGCSNCGAHGIAVYGTSASSSVHDILIDGNEVRDCVLGWSESVVVNGNVEDFEITNNEVHDNNNIGIDAIGFEGECAGCSDALDRARDGVIRGNLVYNIDSLGNPSYGGERSADGIYVDGGTRIVIEGNTVRDCNIGIELASEHNGKSTSEVIVRNNFVSRSHSIGIAIGGYDTNRGSTEDCSIVHNTLFENDTDHSGGGELMMQHDTRGNVIENNIFQANSQNLFVANEFTLNTGNVVDHNLYYAAAGAAASEWIWKTDPYTGFAAWQAGSGNDANSVFVDPLLVSPAAGDLHLGASSPAIGAAVALDPAVAGTEDIDGNPRVSGAAADIGADELACGNGNIDGDEDCDDGNLVSGDGCDANCTVSACGNGVVTMGEACDDGNLAAGDCCDASCAFEAAASACNDGEACTFGDVCDGAGACAGSAAVEPSCLLPDPATGGSRLQLGDKNSRADKLGWSWGKGGAISLMSLGDPVGGDDYRLCVFADDGLEARVLVDALAPGGAARWSGTTKVVKYSDATLSPDGLKQLKFNVGDAGRARIKVKGKGLGLGLDGLGFDGIGAVSAQLRNETTGACFAAAYPAPFRRDDPTRFDDKTD
ncbi:MAG: right-handed parallel beta-helix repeat-containing protein [Candidatus Binatia bacterium]